MVLAAMPSTYQEGDLVFRRGEGIFSDIARHFFSTDKRYSHVGILINYRQKPHVIHSIHEESRGYNGVVIETLSDFLNGIQDWAIYRLKLPKQQQLKMATIALHYVQQQIPFDPYFDLSTLNALYCTEFIWRVANEAAHPNPINPSTTDSGARFISIENIYKHDKVKLIETMARDNTTPN
jgi:hypothetical protein